MDYVALGVSLRFYEAALAPLGFGVPYSDEGQASVGLERADRGADDFWILAREASSAGVHVAFAAGDRAAADAGRDAALGAGGRDSGAPGLRPEYHAGYYAAFVLDPDGNNVEAVHHERTAR